jgi:hypothetical protein
MNESLALAVLMYIPCVDGFFWSAAWENNVEDVLNGKMLGAISPSATDLMKFFANSLPNQTTPVFCSSLEQSPQNQKYCSLVYNVFGS